MENPSEKLASINGCILMPTYNNERTLERVLKELLEIIPGTRLLVVNDGATDSTAEILAKYTDQITIITNDPNRGKGYSLRRGFQTAIEKGFEQVITIDSDGQHFPSDLNLILDAAIEHPGAVIMGSRNMEQEGVPQKSSFGNKFSNFWFKIETGITLPDTQTGYRLYPLAPLKKMRLFTRKFELEIEVIVRLAWKNVPFIPVKIQVKYDPNERVSHFRPGRDFFRISVLNTVLVIAALLYHYPKKLFSIKTHEAIMRETFKPEESNLSKAVSLGFGVFMGIVPIWGFQLIVGIPLAILFRMNKVLFIAAANISIPPMIPFILYGSLLLGQLFTGGAVNFEQVFDLSSEAIQRNIVQYVIGAMLLAVLAFTAVFLVSYCLLRFFRKELVQDQK